MTPRKTAPAYTLHLTDGTAALVSPLPPSAAQLYGMSWGGAGGVPVLVTVLQVTEGVQLLQVTGGVRGRPSITTYAGHMEVDHVAGRAGWEVFPKEAVEELVAAVNAFAPLAAGG